MTLLSRQSEYKQANLIWDASHGDGQARMLQLEASRAPKKIEKKRHQPGLAVSSFVFNLQIRPQLELSEN